MMHNKIAGWKSDWDNLIAEKKAKRMLEQELLAELEEEDDEDYLEQGASPSNKALNLD